MDEKMMVWIWLQGYEVHKWAKEKLKQLYKDGEGKEKGWWSSHNGTRILQALIMITRRCEESKNDHNLEEKWLQLQNEEAMQEVSDKDRG